MKRGHTALEYKAKIRKIQEARPGISLSSDFIIGFPGETDQDFEKTVELIQSIGFAAIGIHVLTKQVNFPCTLLDVGEYFLQ